MFNFLNLGFDGYQRIAIKDLRNARLLSRALESTYFTVLSNIHRKLPGIAETPGEEGEDIHELYEKGLPVVAFWWVLQTIVVLSDFSTPNSLSDEFKTSYPHVKQEWISVSHIERIHEIMRG